MNIYGFDPSLFGVQIGCGVVFILAVVNLVRIAIKNRKEKQ